MPSRTTGNTPWTSLGRIEWWRWNGTRSVPSMPRTRSPGFWRQGRDLWRTGDDCDGPAPALQSEAGARAPTTRRGVSCVPQRFGVPTGLADQPRRDGLDEKLRTHRVRSMRLVLKGRPEGIRRDRLQLSDLHEEPRHARSMGPTLLREGGTEDLSREDRLMHGSRPPPRPTPAGPPRRLPGRAAGRSRPKP